jgi:hypothetical protein
MTTSAITPRYLVATTRSDRGSAPANRTRPTFLACFSLDSRSRRRVPHPVYRTHFPRIAQLFLDWARSGISDTITACPPPPELRACQASLPQNVLRYKSCRRVSPQSRSGRSKRVRLSTVKRRWLGSWVKGQTPGAANHQTRSSLPRHARSSGSHAQRGCPGGARTCDRTLDESRAPAGSTGHVCASLSHARTRPRSAGVFAPSPAACSLARVSVRRVGACAVSGHRQAPHPRRLTHIGGHV